MTRSLPAALLLSACLLSSCTVYIGVPPAPDASTVGTASSPGVTEPALPSAYLAELDECIRSYHDCIDTIRSGADSHKKELDDSRASNYSDPEYTDAVKNDPDFAAYVRQRTESEYAEKLSELRRWRSEGYTRMRDGHLDILRDIITKYGLNLDAEEQLPIYAPEDW